MVGKSKLRYGACGGGGWKLPLRTYGRTSNKSVKTQQGDNGTTSWRWFNNLEYFNTFDNTVISEQGFEEGDAFNLAFTYAQTWEIGWAEILYSSLN